jgi:hypothetical protein
LVRDLPQASRLSIGIDRNTCTARLLLRDCVRRSLMNDLRRE